MKMEIHSVKTDEKETYYWALNNGGTYFCYSNHFGNPDLAYQDAVNFTTLLNNPAYTVQEVLPWNPTPPPKLSLLEGGKSEKDS